MNQKFLTSDLSVSKGIEVELFPSGFRELGSGDINGVLGTMAVVGQI